MPGWNFENSENVGAPTHFKVFRVSCPTTGREAALKTLKMLETQTNFKVFRVSCPAPGRGATLNTLEMMGPPHQFQSCQSFVAWRNGGTAS